MGLGTAAVIEGSLLGQLLPVKCWRIILEGEVTTVVVIAYSNCFVE